MHSAAIWTNQQPDSDSISIWVSGAVLSLGFTRGPGDENEDELEDAETDEEELHEVEGLEDDPQPDAQGDQPQRRHSEHQVERLYREEEAGIAAPDFLLCVHTYLINSSESTLLVLQRK